LFGEFTKGRIQISNSVIIKRFELRDRFLRVMTALEIIKEGGLTADLF
jgi:hypothetical protein